MAPIHVSAERVIPAPAPAVYALLADYKSGHPTILPPAFSDFRVLEGGAGAGTRIRYALTIGGRGRDVEAVVAEPEPGRVLTETTVEGGLMTTFTVDPIGDRTRLRFDTTWEPNRGLTGLIERLAAPRLLGKLYREELDLIERWAMTRGD